MSKLGHKLRSKKNKICQKKNFNKEKRSKKIAYRTNRKIVIDFYFISVFIRKGQKQGMMMMMLSVFFIRKLI